MTKIGEVIADLNHAQSKLTCPYCHFLFWGGGIEQFLCTYVAPMFANFEALSEIKIAIADDPAFTVDGCLKLLCKESLVRKLSCFRLC